MLAVAVEHVPFDFVLNFVYWTVSYIAVVVVAARGRVDLDSLLLDDAASAAVAALPVADVIVVVELLVVVAVNRDYNF